VRRGAGPWVLLVLAAAFLVTVIGVVMFVGPAGPPPPATGESVDEVLPRTASNPPPAAGSYSTRLPPVDPPGPAPPGTVLLRLIEAKNGRGILVPAQSVLVWTWMDPTWDRIHPAWEELHSPAPGWITVPVSAPRPRRDLELRVPGYRPEPISLEPPPPGETVRLVPDPLAVRGVLLAPAGSGLQTLVSVVDRTDGSLASFSPFSRGIDLVRVRGVPEGPGPFALSVDVPGQYELRVRWTRLLPEGEETWWSVRGFQAGRSEVDLGSIEAERGVDLRARLLAPEPASLARGPELTVLIHRGGEGAQGVGYGEKRGWPRLYVWPNGVPDPWENVDPEGVKEQNGWWRWSGFLPGSEVVLAAPSFPGVWKRIRLPAEAGKTATAELDARGPTTDCVFHFTIDGRQPADWGAIRAGPCYDEDFKSGTGVLEAAIPLGRHRVIVEATMDAEEGGTELYEVEFEVKSTGRWETTFDLKPKER